MYLIFSLLLYEANFGQSKNVSYFFKNINKLSNIVHFDLTNINVYVFNCFRKISYNYLMFTTIFFNNCDLLKTIIGSEKQFSLKSSITIHAFPQLSGLFSEPQLIITSDALYYLDFNIFVWYS